MYDLLCVGSGISAATVCAAVRHRLRVCVVDVRDHLGGNCYDEPMDGSYVHRYGPHVFHSTSPTVVNFLSQFTEWSPASYTVSAEIEHDGRLINVPFPYCRLTEKAIGRALTEDEVINRFFKGYSEKMWGMAWDDLPQSVKGRVPKDTADTPSYFPGQFVALPKHGYTRMIENMLDGTDIRLGVGPREWEHIPAKQILYCGRPDFLPVPGQGGSYQECFGLSLEHRSLRIDFTEEDWNCDTVSKNFCSLRRPYTRKSSYSVLTGGRSRVISCETPYTAEPSDLSPYYPVPRPENIRRHGRLLKLIQAHHPTLIPCGRLATYKYLDMYQAVGQALGIVKKHFGQFAIPAFAEVEFGEQAA